MYFVHLIQQGLVLACGIWPVSYKLLEESSLVNLLKRMRELFDQSLAFLFLTTIDCQLFQQLGQTRFFFLLLLVELLINILFLFILDTSTLLLLLVVLDLRHLNVFLQHVLDQVLHLLFDSITFLESPPFRSLVHLQLVLHPLLGSSTLVY